MAAAALPQVHDKRVDAADATAPGDHVTTAGYSPNAVRAVCVTTSPASKLGVPSCA